MTAFTEWLDDVMPELPQCPQALALYHVKRAAFDLMRRGRVFRKTSDAITVNANPGNIDLSSVAGTDYQVLTVLRAWWFGTELNPSTLEGVESEYTDAWADEKGDPKVYLQQAYGSIRLVPEPSSQQVDALRVSIVYGPDESLTTCPAEVYSRYREPIAFGAKARLMLMDQKPWSNPEKALRYQAIFNEAVLAAALMKTRGTGGSQWTTKPHPF